MAEQLLLTSPLVTSTTVSDVQIAGFLSERLPSYHFVIKWRDTLGNFFSYEAGGAEAESLVAAFNKANLSVKSAERRALEYLQSRGKVGAGTISGTPD